MAILKLSEGAFLQRLSRSFRNDDAALAAELHRLERKYNESLLAANEWTSLLRDLEQRGQTADANYERYFRAYLDAKRQLKRAEMDLFNARHVRAT